MSRLDYLLGDPEHETVATPEAFHATAQAALNVPGNVHTGEGL